MSQNTHQQAHHKPVQHQPVTPMTSPTIEATPATDMTMVAQARMNPHGVTPRNVIALQRVVGNGAVQRLLHEAGHVGLQVQRDNGDAKANDANAANKDQSVPKPFTLSNERFTAVGRLKGIAEGGKPLSQSDNGKTVKTVQTALLDVGYALLRYKDDGKYGGETSEAIRLFRKDRGLSDSDQLDYVALYVLDRVAPPPGKITEHFVDYEKLLADNRLDFTIALGYDEGQSHLQSSITAQNWLKDHQFKLKSGGGDQIESVYEAQKEITYPNAKGEKVTKSVTVSVKLITPGAGAAKAFADSLNQSEIMMYTGHARGGLGPDFDDKHKADEQVVIGAHSSLHDQKGSSVKTPKDPYWKSVESNKQNTLEQMTKSGAWDEKKYRLWFFYACTSLNYLDELRGGVLPPGMDRKNLDVIGSNKSVPVVAGLLPTFTLIEGVLNAQTMEQIMVNLQKKINEALQAQPNVAPAELKAALKEYEDALFLEGVGDNQAAKSTP